MSSLTEKRYYIEAGEGEKRDTCPSYSYFEDGRDAKSGIIPPKDHILKGFRFDPHCPDDSYNGTLYAEYEMAPLSTRLKLNYGKYVLAFFGILVVLVILAALGVFSNDNSTPNTPRQTPQLIDTVSNSLPSKTDSIPTGNSNDTLISKEEPSSTKEGEPIESTEITQFKREFWELIHRRERQMDTYNDLYLKYKGTVKCQEYDYLRSTILESSTAYREWVSKLRKIPSYEIEDIDNIDALIKKFKETK